MFLIIQGENLRIFFIYIQSKLNFIISLNVFKLFYFQKYKHQSIATIKFYLYTNQIQNTISMNLEFLNLKILQFIYSKN